MSNESVYPFSQKELDLQTKHKTITNKRTKNERGGWEGRREKIHKEKTKRGDR